VNVVSLLATVHDKNGQIVKDLKADDFVLEEDGVPQRIRYFSKEIDLPLTVGLLIDTRKGSWERKIQPAPPFSGRCFARAKIRRLS
jgi:hypothetical protein